MNLNLGIKADFNMPLVSYGGINMIVNMGLLALVLSIYRRKDIIVYPEFYSEEDTELNSYDVKN